jgi:hypothetical protein
VQSTTPSAVAYDSLGLTPLREGSPVFDANTGQLAAIHLESGCDAPGGTSSAVRMSSVLASSPRLDEIVVGGLHDFNGDGHPDIAFQNTKSGTLTARFLGAARDEKVLAERPLGTTFASPWLAGPLADFNGDGHLDIAAANPTTGTLAIALFGGDDGTTLLQAVSVAGSLGDDRLPFAAVDADGDARADLITWHPSSGMVDAIFLAPDLTAIRGESNVMSGALSTAVMMTAGDMNRDGIPDLLYVDPTEPTPDNNPKTWVWYMKRVGTGLRGDYRGVGGWNSGDWRAFNASDRMLDGWLSLEWENPNDGQMGTWVPQGSGGIDVAGAYSLGPSLDVASGVRPIP